MGIIHIAMTLQALARIQALGISLGIGQPLSTSCGPEGSTRLQTEGSCTCLTGQHLVQGK